jgi:hypothetical protein
LLKRRTREHVIADLSINHAERFILKCGHVCLEVSRDYGYDLMVFTHDANGEPEKGHFYIQLKASENLRWIQAGAVISFRAEWRDLRHWQAELLPVILIVYEVSTDKAYWLYVQRYLHRVLIPSDQETMSLAIPAENVLDEAAVERLRGFKINVEKQMRGAVDHES